MPTFTADKLAKYYPPMTEAELEAAKNATRETTSALADKVEDKARKLHERWTQYAFARWGADGFASVPSPKDRTEFEADKATYAEFRDWLLVSTPPTSTSWRDTYAEVKSNSVAQFFPGYWKSAWIRVYGNDRDVNFFNGELDEWASLHPPKPNPPKPNPPKPNPPKPEPEPPNDEPPIAQASVAQPEGASGWFFLAAAGATLGWLALRRRK